MKTGDLVISVMRRGAHVFQCLHEDTGRFDEEPCFRATLGIVLVTKHIRALEHTVPDASEVVYVLTHDGGVGWSRAYDWYISHETG